jgi:hypothetical protein
MSTQTQCPNCGGYKVSSTKVPILQKIPAARWQRIAAGLFGLLLLSLASLIIRADWGYYEIPNYVWGCGCAGLLLVALALSASWQSKRLGNTFNFIVNSVDTVGNG